MLLPHRPPLHHEDTDGASGGPRPWWRRPKVIAMVGTTALLVGWGLTHGQPTKSTTEQPGGVKQATIAQTEPYVGPQEPEAPAESPKPPKATPPPQPPKGQPPQFANGPPPQIHQPSAPQPPAGIMPAGVPHGGGGGRYAAMSSFDVRKAPTVQKPVEPDQTGFKFDTAKIDVDKASPAMDETYLLQPGLLPIELNVAIDSNLPGPLFGHVVGNIYSNKGLLLIEDGSPVQGRYESMKNGGVNRLFAVNAYIHTPRGIWVKIPEEQFGDDLGRVGLEGTVEQHYGQRFGAAIGLNIGEAFMQILQAEVSKGGNTYLNLNSGGGGVSSLASQILQQSINIPATFSRPQGSLGEILISRPIDFSDSYRIQRVSR